ncbi:MAG: DUF7544 domain-containing protein [Halobacteriota archaeon]
MDWYVVEAVDKAVSRTKRCLFEPIDFWKWMKLTIVIMLIGGTGGNFNSSGNRYATDTFNIPDSGPADRFSKIFGGFADQIPTTAPDLGMIIGIVVLILALILLFSYISSVMEFVFVDSLVSNKVKFWEYSRKFLRKGLGLFTLRLLIGIIILVIIAIMTLPIILPLLATSGESFPENLGMSIISVTFLLIGIILLVAIVGGIINSFVNLAIPVAIYTETGIFRAFANVFGQFRKDWKQIIAYWFGRIILAIGIAIVVGLLMLLAIIIAGLMFLMLDAIIYFAISAVLTSDIAVWIVLAPIILIELAILILLLAFIALPARVFMKYHMITFLQQWYPEVNIPTFDKVQIRDLEKVSGK